MAVLKNRAKMSTSTTGTGTITLGSAESGYQTFADAGVANADVVRYVIEDGSNWEIGTGTYTATGTTLSRTVSESSNADAAINLSGSATVFIGATAEDIPALYADNPSSPTSPSATGTNAAAIGSGVTASGYGSFAAGNASTASGSDSIVLGSTNTASGTHSFAVGGGSATASGARSISIGYASDAASNEATAVGRTAQARNTSANAFGRDSYSAGNQSTAIGDAYASGADSLAAAIASNSSSYGASQTSTIAIGYQAKASNTYAVAIGRTAIAQGDTSLALGEAQASGVRSVAIGTTTSSGKGATALYSIAIGYNSSSTGTGGFAAGVEADVNNQYAIAGPYARGWGNYGVAFGFEAQSEANHAVSIGSSSGANGARNTGAGAVVLGGSHASGTDSFAAVIDNNTSSYGATGANSIAMGQQAKATASQAFTVNGYAQGTRSIAIGASSHATSTYGCAIGYDTTAVGSALALGTQANAQAGYSVAIHRGKAEQRGKIAFSGGIFATQGDAQGGQFVLLADTTDATATVLTSNNGSASTDNQIVAASDTCITFDGTITAMQNGAQAYASWKIEGLLVNDGGTTTLANSATTVISNLSSWGMALSADNTNNALAITVTGEASHNIRWVANIRTTEVTYA